MGKRSLNGSDILAQWMMTVKEASSIGAENLIQVLKSCFSDFLRTADALVYRNDDRLVKLFILYADACERFDDVFSEMEQKQIGTCSALRYAAYAVFLENSGDLSRADQIYRLGISRHAEPFMSLQTMQLKFRERLADVVKLASEKEKSGCVNLQPQNPWSIKTIAECLSKVDVQMDKCRGYNVSLKNYPGKIWSTKFKDKAEGKKLEIDGINYYLKGCLGEGGFATVYKAFIEGYADNIVALKIQHPPCVWEFYVYLQLDKRICPEERSSFGSAQMIHVFSDCSVLVCDYMEHGTLQDLINSYLARGQLMDELLCIYYTIEILRIVELMHSAKLIHGDLKPDNFLVRYGSEALLDDWNPSRQGGWKNQGLSLIDFGRTIDLTLFPGGTEFLADCRTKDFRCIEMVEKKPWTFQTDTYCVCAIAHAMLHGCYMELMKETSVDGTCSYRPKISFKRYWNADLWKEFFMTLLNVKSCNENPNLGLLRRKFEDYLSSSGKFRSKLKSLLQIQKSFTNYPNKRPKVYK